MLSKATLTRPQTQNPMGSGDFLSRDPSKGGWGCGHGSDERLGRNLSSPFTSTLGGQWAALSTGPTGDSRVPGRRGPLQVP